MLCSNVGREALHSYTSCHENHLSKILFWQKKKTPPVHANVWTARRGYTFYRSKLSFANLLYEATGVGSVGIVWWQRVWTLCRNMLKYLRLKPSSVRGRFLSKKQHLQTSGTPMPIGTSGAQVKSGWSAQAAHFEYAEGSLHLSTSLEGNRHVVGVFHDQPFPCQYSIFLCLFPVNQWDKINRDDLETPRTHIGLREPQIMSNCHSAGYDN